MLLELDVGNTRLKWRVLDDAGARAAGGVVVGRDLPLLLEQLLAAWQAAGIHNPARIRVSSVRGEPFRRHCEAFLLQRLGVSPEFAVAQAQCGWVRNGYAEPQRLGVDRWLALLAAYDDARSACCIVDCGTTITLDVVRADGQHLGGYIVPGLALMRDSLAGRSAALVHADLPPATGLGCNTAEAITHGTFSMALGLLRDQHRHLSDECGELQWYCTGGDAPLLAQHLAWEHRLVPDLVLDGLRLALP